MADMRTARRGGPVDHRATDNRLIGWGLILVVLGGMLVLTLLYDAPEQTPEADTLAQELVIAMDSAGMDTPDPDVVAQTYGTDGGAVCRTSGDDLPEAQFNANHAHTGEVTGRPNLVDPRVVQYQRIMIRTYCPARLDSFNDFVAGLRTRETLTTLD